MKTPFLLPALLLVACNSAPTPAKDGAGEAPTKPEATAKKAEAAAKQHFGGTFTLDKTEALSAVIARLDKGTDKPTGDAKGGDHECDHGKDHSAGAAKDKAPKQASKDAPKAAAAGGEADSCGEMTKPEGENVRVSGTVKAVCQKAGCWLVIEDGGHQVRIFTKDHGFVVPKDSTGRKADVEGTIRARTLSAKFAKHLAEDGAKDPSQVKGPLREYVMTATAVEMM